MEVAMKRAQGAVGTRCRQLAVFGPQQHHTQLQRSCIAFAGRERHSRSTGAGQAAPPSAWVLPTSLVSEQSTKDAAAAAPVSVSDPDAPPLTVYTIRFTTGVSRGAAPSDPYAAVNVCLIGQDGQAVLHRVSPVNDPIQSRAHTVEMCQLIGPDVGADCSMALADAAASSGTDGSQPGQGQQQQQQQRPTQPGATSSSGSGRGMVGRPPPPPPPKRRFQEGSIDEVSILVPELGPLAGVLVGVEAGTWYLDEMDVSSSRTHHLDRFVCRRQLGGKVGEGAAMLTPVPVGAVVYGEGEAAVILTKEQATALWSFNMSDYSDLKRRVAATTALLVASGASLAALTGGTAAALPYTAGGIVGLVYQWLLMRGVDHVMEAASGQHHHHHHHQAHNQQPQQQQQQQQALTGSAPLPPSADSGASTSTSAAASASAQPGLPTTTTTTTPASASPAAASAAASASSRVLGSAPLRLGFVCASAALGMALLSREEAGLSNGAAAEAAVSSVYSPSAAWQLALGVLGFLTYKAALVGVSLGEAGGSAGGLGGLGLGGLGGKVLHGSGGGGGRTEREKYKRD
ncbi:hypothetical protein PLESTB_000756800 [Pleodorina starrii]|uniref:Uncharacterized protein n=1 Tax=Pleodorina starrii TaxID=330485 RepID=A0A9W6F2L7_9CHLO|nr:hypothetical protein PLESTM_001572800 [Pleodorina starrii]GLC53505.1 hypothetical protein PLESTB_000756800 [Pleodorina starrii]GLC65799.1 hypothetical protein PLESTF_000341300 [Pleodorina starrii]